MPLPLPLPRDWTVTLSGVEPFRSVVGRLWLKVREEMVKAPFST